MSDSSYRAGYTAELLSLTKQAATSTGGSWKMPRFIDPKYLKSILSMFDLKNQLGFDTGISVGESPKATSTPVPQAPPVNKIASAPINRVAQAFYKSAKALVPGQKSVVTGQQFGNLPKSKIQYAKAPGLTPAQKKWMNYVKPRWEQMDKDWDAYGDQSWFRDTGYQTANQWQQEIEDYNELMKYSPQERQEILNTPMFGTKWDPNGGDDGKGKWVTDYSTETSITDPSGHVERSSEANAARAALLGNFDRHTVNSVMGARNWNEVGEAFSPALSSSRDSIVNNTAAQQNPGEAAPIRIYGWGQNGENADKVWGMNPNITAANMAATVAKNEENGLHGRDAYMTVGNRADVAGSGYDTAAWNAFAASRKPPAGQPPTGQPPAAGDTATAQPPAGQPPTGQPPAAGDTATAQPPAAGDTATAQPPAGQPTTPAATASAPKTDAPQYNYSSDEESAMNSAWERYNWFNDHKLDESAEAVKARSEPTYTRGESAEEFYNNNSSMYGDDRDAAYADYYGKKGIKWMPADVDFAVHGKARNPAAGTMASAPFVTGRQVGGSVAKNAGGRNFISGGSGLFAGEEEKDGRGDYHRIGRGLGTREMDVNAV